MLVIQCVLFSKHAEHHEHTRRPWPEIITSALGCEFLLPFLHRHLTDIHAPTNTSPNPHCTLSPSFASSLLLHPLMFSCHPAYSYSAHAQTSLSPSPGLPPLTRFHAHTFPSHTGTCRYPLVFLRLVASPSDHVSMHICISQVTHRAPCLVRLFYHDSLYTTLKPPRFQNINIALYLLFVPRPKYAPGPCRPPPPLRAGLSCCSDTSGLARELQEPGGVRVSKYWPAIGQTTSLVCWALYVGLASFAYIYAVYDRILNGTPATHGIRMASPTHMATCTSAQRCAFGTYTHT